VPLFSRAEITPAALSYFATFGKTPPAALVAKLESTAATGNALYLRAVLDELRQFGSHEELAGRADDYLSARDPKELYERILERWEQDFGEDLVRQSLVLIWAARHGLSEAEILDLLGGHSEQRAPLPRAVWTPLYLAAESSMVQRAGLLNFSHEYVRQSVAARYLSTAAARRSAHDALKRYFEPQELRLRSASSARLVSVAKRKIARKNRGFWTYLVGDFG
jgi:hypothetical protein